MALHDPRSDEEALPAPPTGVVALFSLGSTARRAPPAGYSYVCEDRSILKVFYSWLFVRPLAAIMPAWVHANDLTFLAQAFALVPAIVGIYAFHGEAPGWVWGVLPPLGYLGYIVLDHLDGTFARKTKTSSPLGELVDHWCDAWNAPLLSFAWGLNWCASPVLASALGFVTGLALCAAYQEHRVSGTMRLDTLGSNEALTGMALSMVAMGIFGREAITQAMLPLGIPLAFVLQMVSLGGSSGAVVMALARRGPRVFFGIMPFVVASLGVMLWVRLGLDPRIAPFTMAACSAIVGGRIVLERTTGLPARVDWLGLALLGAGVVLAALRVASGVQTVAALLVTLALVARACADFLWGARTLRRFLREGELLARIVSPDRRADS